jgi:cytidyltransferase-like protein
VSETPTLGAPILALEEASEARAGWGRTVLTSGGYDPIHPGHISCILESRAYGDVTVVVVNGDAFLRAKKGRPFQDLSTRCLIVSALREVDYVVPFEIEGDTTVRQALEAIKPDVFTKGGDRVDATSIPEWETCERLGIEVVTGVGLDKQWSSSDFLADWEAHVRDNG